MINPWVISPKCFQYSMSRNSSKNISFSSLRCIRKNPLNDASSTPLEKPGEWKRGPFTLHFRRQRNIVGKHHKAVLPHCQNQSTLINSMTSPRLPSTESFIFCPDPLPLTAISLLRGGPERRMRYCGNYLIPINADVSAQDANSFVEVEENRCVEGRICIVK